MGIEIPNGDYMQVLRWSMAGDAEEMVSTMGLQSDTLQSLEQSAEDLYGYATSPLSITGVGALLSGWTFVGVTLYRNSALGLQVAEYNLPITGGAGADVSVPNNCAVLYKKQTAFAGAKNRGRGYLPPYQCQEEQVSRAGVHSGSQYAVIQDELSQWLFNLTANEWTPVVHHSDGSPGVPITGFVLSTQIATQRRRMR